MSETLTTAEREALAGSVAAAMSDPHLEPEQAIYPWGAHARRVVDWLVSDWGLSSVPDARLTAAEALCDEWHRRAADHHVETGEPLMVNLSAYVSHLRAALASGSAGDTTGGGA